MKEEEHNMQEHRPEETIESLHATIEQLESRLKEYERLITMGHALSQPPDTAGFATEGPVDIEKEYTDDTSDDARKMKYPVEGSEGVPQVTYPYRPRYDTAAAPPLHPATQLIHFDGCPNDPYHPATVPIYQTATFVQPSASEYGPYDYTRSGNPTRTALETLCGKMDCAYSAFAFTSGMAALTAVVRLLNAGDEIIACADLYGGMHRLLTQVASRQGVVLKLVDTVQLANVSAAITPLTRMIHVESPSNPLMRITDLQALANLAHGIRSNILVVVDATMMTPIMCQPLLLGTDIVVHSATKFLNGHSDVMAGVVCVKDAVVAKGIAFLQNAEGTALSPFDCWLVLRGLKTLALRVERAQLNATIVAQFMLAQTHFLKKLYHAGTLSASPFLAGDEAQRAVHAKQCKGVTTVMSFETGDERLSQRFVDACYLFKITVSFGSGNSLVEMPCLLSHASIPKEKRTLPADLVRLSIGIEDVADLLIDLQRAIKFALSGAVDVRKSVSKSMGSSPKAGEK